MSYKIKCEVCGKELETDSDDWAACDGCGRPVCKECDTNTGDDEFLCQECMENEKKKRS